MKMLKPLCMLCFAVALLASCAAEQRSGDLPQRLEAPGSTSAPVPAAEEGEFFRHKVKISTPAFGAPLSFDGIMYITEESASGAKEVHVAGLGGMGLRLFSMTVTQDGFYPEYLHPSLARVAHVEEYIALCVRVIWIEGRSAGEGWRVTPSAKAAAASACPREDGGPAPEGMRTSERGQTPKGTQMPERAQTLERGQTSASWQNPEGTPGLPEITSFIHAKPEFTVEIRCVEHSGPRKGAP